MRDIKFRGRGLESNKWVYGNLFKNEITTRIIPSYAIIDSDGILDEYFTVIPETVGQFTGLKDKNGVDIYEGDVFGNGVLICVVERQGDGAYILRFISPKMKGKTISILDPKVSNSVISGNIYEKPELIK